MSTERGELAEAWDEGYRTGRAVTELGQLETYNPYRTEDEQVDDTEA